MNKIVSILLLAAGAIILIVGINAANSITSETTQAIAGAPTDKALWLMIGGGAAAVIGLVGLMSRPRAVS